VCIKVTIRCLRVTIVAMGAQQLSHCLSVALVTWHAMSMSHFVNLWPVWFYLIFPHYLFNGTTYGKKNIIQDKICFLFFSATIVWNISHSKKNWARYCYKCQKVFMQSASYSCQILMNLEFPWNNTEKHSNIKFHENPYSGNWVLPRGRTDRQT
jgi:hypothetical protein